MVNAKITHCPQGHEYTEANILWSVGSSGKPQRSCRTCRSARIKFKYHNDPIYNAREKARARARKR